MEYGSLETAARRRLTDAEMRWNAELIEAEWSQQRRGSASAATPATPASATDPPSSNASGCNNPYSRNASGCNSSVAHEVQGLSF